jgi:hypothetical protein
MNAQSATGGTQDSKPLLPFTSDKGYEDLGIDLGIIM